MVAAAIYEPHGSIAFVFAYFSQPTSQILLQSKEWVCFHFVLLILVHLLVQTFAVLLVVQPLFRVFALFADGGTLGKFTA
tara:strand:- start:11353 stop:11592 length:240 start_codon:yes stop_codon:yes gene_type:complete